MKKIYFIISFLLISSFGYGQEAYYDDINTELTSLTGTSLKDALATKIINTHSNFLTYTPDVWEASKVTDVNPTNSQEVLLIYGYENGTDGNLDNDRERGINDNGGDNNDWNREHVFARSLGDPNLGTVGPGADAHHLRPSDPSRNSSRSNRKFGRGSGNSGFSSIDFHEGLDGPNTAAYYPGDEWRGDVARMMMYMYLRYGTVCLPTAVGVGDNSTTPDDMIDLFLVWNVEDPVSDFEKARNTFHENTANTYAQGNRNPFIDNPFLATRIWGGDSAQDLWGIYTTNDTEDPSIPTNITITNETFTSLDISWTASTDNEAVTGYNVYVDGTLTTQTTSNTSVVLTGLIPNTTYAITISSKDLVNNQSAQSIAVNGTTLEDTIAPSAPTNVTASNISDSSFVLTWTTSTDNNIVAGYDIYVDGTLNGSVTTLTYTVTGLTTTTDYTAYVIAKDSSDNESTASNTVNVTTTAGSSGVATELFFSEYVEPSPGNGNNKAIEIVNLTGATVNLAGYTIQKQSNGDSWVDDFDLSTGAVTSIVPGDVFVIVHSDTADSHLLAEADLLGPPNIDTSPFRYGSPLNFNGNDPIGLYKNGVLIDVIGNIGASSFDIEDVTLRRNSEVTAPRTTYIPQAEWTEFPANTYDDIGSFTSSVLNVDEASFISFKMFPNPTNGSSVFFSIKEDAKIKVYNLLGKLVLQKEINLNNNEINISRLNSGIYIVKVSSGDQFITKKLIKK
jgi:endonuclease I/chitodextrinase